MKVTLLLCLLSLVYASVADEYDIIQSVSCFFVATVCPDSTRAQFPYQEDDETAPSGVDAMGDTVCDDVRCVLCLRCVAKAERPSLPVHVRVRNTKRRSDGM